MPIITNCKIYGPTGKCIHANVLLDNSSTANYITTEKASELSLAPQFENVITIKLNEEVEERVPISAFYLKIPMKTEIECTIVEKIIPALPSAAYKKAQRFVQERMKGIHFNPIGKDQVKIHILIGLKHLPQIYTEDITILDNLALHKTKLGNYILGTKNNTTRVHQDEENNVCLVTGNKNLNIESLILQEDLNLKTYVEDALNMRDFSITEDEEEKIEDILQKFYKEIIKTKDNEGNIRYQVPLLFKNEKGKNSVPVNKGQAVGILNSNIDRLIASGKLEDFEKKCIKDHLDGGIFQIIDPAESKEKHNYIPSFAVYNDKSTSTPMRLVVAANLPKGNCINDHLLKGINLLPMIDKLIHKWRAKPIGLVGDIKKAYYAIQIKPEHRRHLTIVWYSKPLERKDLLTLVLTRLPMGSTNSQFQMIAVFKFHIAHDQDKEAGQELDDSFYSDNSVLSIDTKDPFELVVRMVELMQRGGFDLRKFSTNDANLREKLMEKGVYNTEELESTRVLGHVWDLNTDEMCLSPLNYEPKETWTLRQILGICHTAYDPMGLGSAVLINGTQFYSTICPKYKWDDPLSSEDVQTWLPVYQELCEATKLRTPRFYNLESSDPVVMHILVDAATSKWMGALVYLTQNGRSILVRGKAKLYPKNLRESEDTCPKKELTAMVVGTRLYQSTRNALRSLYPNMSYRMYSDSEIALAQVVNGPKDSIFVTNRVKLIREILGQEVTLHKISTQNNTSDLVSRGMKSSILLDPNSMYWTGPPELHQDVPVFEPSNSTSGQFTLATVQKPVTSILDMVKDRGTLYQKKRTLSLLLRACALLAKRLHMKGMDDKSKWLKSNLSERQLSRLAAVMIHREEQARVIPDVIDYLEKKQGVGTQRYIGPRPALVHPLDLWLDSQKIVRCGGRLSKAPQTFSEKHPILYHKESPLFSERVRDAHESGLHCHTKLTKLRLFKNLWIPAGSIAIGQIVKKCVTCRLAAGPPFRNPAPASLPECRLEINAYAAIMVDFCGPFYVRNNKKEVVKAFILVITCTSSKHLTCHVLPDMTAATVIHALRRHSAIYGTAYRIYSDRATDFLKSKAILGEKLANEFVSLVAEKLGKKGIVWSENVSAASPWQSGLVERAVQILKSGLRRIIGRRIVSYDELVTLSAECCCISNERAITEPSANLKDPIGVCPNQLIFGRSIAPMGYGESLDDHDLHDPDFALKTDSDLIRSWKKLSNTISSFKRFFQEEWLACLRQRHAYDAKVNPVHVPSPEVGDLCIIPKDNITRSLWERARLEEILPSNDGKARACRLRTSGGRTITRPLSKIYPILQSSEMSQSLNPDESCQEPNRGVNAPNDPSYHCFRNTPKVLDRDMPTQFAPATRPTRAAKDIARKKTREMIEAAESDDD